jgi:hypothetical protein
MKRLALIVTVVALAVPASAAADKYASPDGGGDCSAASPCTLPTATMSAGNGETVFVYGDRGPYSIDFATDATDSIHVVGINGRPRINSTGEYALDLEGPSSTATNLDLFSTGAGGGSGTLYLKGGSADHIIARSTGPSPACGLTDGDLSNSICSSSGSGGGLKTAASIGSITNHVYNVTVLSSESEALALFAGPGLSNFTIVANSILKGKPGPSDGDIQGAGTGTNSVSTTASAFDPTQVSLGAGGSIAQDPSNVSAPPLLSSADGSQLAGSPTIDKGQTGFTTGTDVFGDPREQVGICGGSAIPDIGADEFTPSCPAAAVTTTKHKKCKKKKRKRSAGAAKKKKCKKKKKKR